MKLICIDFTGSDNKCQCFFVLHFFILNSAMKWQVCKIGRVATLERPRVKLSVLLNFLLQDAGKLHIPGPRGASVTDYISASFLLQRFSLRE